MKDWNDIEKELKGDAEALNFQFDDQYWDEVEQLLPATEVEAGTTAESISEPTIPAFTFQEEYWDDVEQSLDKRDRRRRFIFYFKLAGGIAAVVAVIGIVFPWNAVTVKNPLIQGGSLLSGVTIEEPTKTHDTQKSTTFATTQLTTSNVAEETVTPIEAPSVERALSTPSTANTSIADTALNRSITDSEQQVQEEPVEVEFAIPLVESTSNSEVNFQAEERKQPAEEELTFLSQKALPSPLFLTDSNAMSATPHLNDLPTKKSIIGSKIFLTTGAMIGYAPRGNAEERSLIGLGGLVGIGYQMQVSNWIFSTGVSVNYRTGINTDLQYNRKYYGARLYTETDHVSYKAITRLEFPLSALVIVNRNTVGVGLIPVYNAAVNSSYHRFNSYDNNELFVKNNFGIRDGIKKYDLKVQLSYSRLLTESFEFGGNASVGLFDQIDREIITNSNGYRDVSLGIFIKYHFLRF